MLLIPMAPHLSKCIFWTKISAHSAIVIDTDLLHVDSKRLIKGEQHC